MLNFKRLEPVFEGKKSYFGKAIVTTDGDTTMLTSYDTVVVKVTEKTITFTNRDRYTATTKRHVKEFIRQLFDCDFANDKLNRMIKKGTIMFNESEVV